MSVRARIMEGPLPGPDRTDSIEGSGAMLVFEGIVRETEDGRKIEALEYEVYQPMAERELERMASEILQRHGLLRVEVWHSRGRVPIGECSFRLMIHSQHRAAALQAMGEFIDRMKRDAPIWKQAVWE